MISIYTGTPGSGKSYHAARDIVGRLKKGGGLICNFPINEKAVRKCKSHVEYWDNSELTAQRLSAYALERHKIGVEGQCLVVIDECQVIFNCRDGRKDRMEWINLFSQHRKMGFDFILITQHDRMMDRQIRYLVENEVKHRKLNNYGFGGAMLSLLTLRSTWFIGIEYWYGGNKLQLNQQMFRYQRKYEKIYDSYRLFSDLAGVTTGTGDKAGCPEGGGPALAPAPMGNAAVGSDATPDAPVSPPPDTSTPGSAVGSDSANPHSR